MKTQIFIGVAAAGIFMVFFVASAGASPLALAVFGLLAAFWFTCFFVGLLERKLFFWLLRAEEKIKQKLVKSQG